MQDEGEVLGKRGNDKGNFSPRPILSVNHLRLELGNCMTRLRYAGRRFWLSCTACRERHRRRHELMSMVLGRRSSGLWGSGGVYPRVVKGHRNEALRNLGEGVWKG